MIDAVTTILRAHHLVDSREEPAYDFSFVSARALNIDAFTRDGSFFHIRVKEQGVWPYEYDNIRSAWEVFPEHVPEPLGRYHSGGWEIIVVRGVAHRQVATGSLAGNRYGLEQQILGYLDLSRRRAEVVAPRESHREFLREVQARATTPACAEIAAQWIAEEHLDLLPHIRQHGDFMVGNFGLTGRGLVIFDWEDFGRVRLPGFDLCTLLASESMFDADRLRAIMAGANLQSPEYGALIDKGCRALGLASDLFRRLIPLYLAVFLDLKRDYGKAIGQRVGKAVQDLQPRAGAGLELDRR